MNKVFGLYETVRINTKNSYLKLNHSFWKTSLYQTCIWNRIPENWKNPANLNTFKHKMKHCHLSNPTLWNNGRFDCFGNYKDCLYFHSIFLHFFLASFCLNDLNKNNAIRLFCVIIAMLFFFSLILLLTIKLFVCCFFF